MTEVNYSENQKVIYTEIKGAVCKYTSFVESKYILGGPEPLIAA